MEIYDPKKIEDEILKFWKDRKIPEKIVKFDHKKKKFYLLDGPPYVNDKPHVGHIKTTTFKDVLGKFKYMQGFAVWFQPGFDCGGLPIENAVEKRLGIKSKDDIERIGVDKFIEECKKLALGNEKFWLESYKKFGVWRGWLEPYLTSENYYLESGFWTVKKLFEKSLLVEGFRPGFWCPRCETSLSGYEATDSYKDLEDYSIFVKFPIRDKKGEYLLVWTTTPWTLPANVAVAVHPDEKYVKVEIGTEKLILAEKRLHVLTELGMGYRVLENFPGKKLDKLKYSIFLDVPMQRKMDKEAHYVVISMPLIKKRVASKTLVKRGESSKEVVGHLVDMDTGSGLVHIAPGHGEVDNKLGKHYKLPEPSPVDDKGRLTQEAGKFAGMFVKDADQLIIEELTKNNFMLFSGKIVHSYPLCWRCKTPLIYRMSNQWFLKLDPIRSKILENNKRVRWLPGFNEERFKNLVEDSPDWAVTRQRYWGIPLPVWVCDKCGERNVIGSVSELRKYSAKKLPDEIDLHKNVLDKIKLKCKCGSEMARLPDIMSVWFDSGISTWASLGYPFKDNGLFENLKPIDFVSEGQDHIRGWFYYLMLCSVATFGVKPFNAVGVSGWTLDEKGDKMSKSVGNVIWADDAYEKLGADLLRLYYCWDVAPWETQKFSIRIVEKELRRVLDVLWNTSVFIKNYSDLSLIDQKFSWNILEPEDKWIVSKTNSLIEKVTKDLDNFRLHYVGRDIGDFVLNDFSRWYIKIIRSRVSPRYIGEDKKSAQLALFYVLENLLSLLAPITPFLTESIYQDIFLHKSPKRPESIHMSAWPEQNKNFVDGELEKQMEIVRSIIEAMNFFRQNEKIKLRWPVSEVLISPKNKEVEDAVKNLGEVIKIMGNVKEAKIDKKLPEKAKEFEGGSLALGAVLWDEALLRELIRKIQTMRKKDRLNVKEKINLWLSSDEKTEETLKKFEKKISHGVGAEKISFKTKEKPKDLLRFEKIKIDIYFEKVGK